MVYHTFREIRPASESGVLSGAGDVGSTMSPAVAGPSGGLARRDSSIVDDAAGGTVRVRNPRFGRRTPASLPGQIGSISDVPTGADTVGITGEGDQIGVPQPALADDIGPPAPSRRFARRRGRTAWDWRLGSQRVAASGLDQPARQIRGWAGPFRAARFLGRKVGGPGEIDGTAREPAEAFAGRRGQRLAGGGALSGQTEAAIEHGLEFLANHQSTDGSWSLNYALGRTGFEKERASFQSDTAATGLALLAFLARATTTTAINISVWYVPALSICCAIKSPTVTCT